MLRLSSGSEETQYLFAQVQVESLRSTRKSQMAVYGLADDQQDHVVRYG